MAKIKTTFQLKRGTAAEWLEHQNLILAAGEPGCETDTHRLKIGDGITSYKDLPYIDVKEALDAIALLHGEGDGSVKQQIAQAIADLVGSAPTTLDTIEELAKALHDDKDVIDAINAAITNKADKNHVDNLQSKIQNLESDTASKVHVGNDMYLHFEASTDFKTTNTNFNTSGASYDSANRIGLIAPGGKITANDTLIERAKLAKNIQIYAKYHATNQSKHSIKISDSKDSYYIYYNGAQFTIVDGNGKTVASTNETSELFPSVSTVDQYNTYAYSILQNQIVIYKNGNPILTYDCNNIIEKIEFINDNSHIYMHSFNIRFYDILGNNKVNDIYLNSNTGSISLLNAQNTWIEKFQLPML